ncbi:MAG: hypothetical protein JXA10_15935, partial [Anaerolineae bacterium]|nr:hypothetical protein [Anaerolineae bacterium]
QRFEWSPTGAWMAYTVAGAVEGQGVYLYAPQEAEVRQITLPDGATEKTVYWAGAEHLFVVRQRQNTFVNELWVVSLTTNESPQRLMTNIAMPQTSNQTNWSWQDVLAAQVLALD